MSASEQQEFRISPDVLFQEISGEAVLLDLSSENYFGLDPVGTRIWQLLNEGRTVSGIVETLLQEYEVERERLVADVGNLLDRLEKAGLVRIGPEDDDKPAAEIPVA